MNNKFNESFTKEMERFKIVDESSQFRVPHNRERTGGLTPGDRVKFVDNIVTSEWFREQPESIQQIVKELHDGDLNLFVDSVTGDYNDVSAVIARELAPGMQCQYSKVEIPANLCEFLAPSGERAGAPIPDSWRGPEKVTIKPEPVNITNEDVPDHPENQTTKADDGTGKLHDIDNTLPEKDVPGSSGGNYTQNYMNG